MVFFAPIALAAALPMQDPPALADVFSRIDADANGVISAEEMVEDRLEHYRALLGERYTALVQENDADADGMLSETEFREMVQAMEARRREMIGQIEEQSRSAPGQAGTVGEEEDAR